MKNPFKGKKKFPTEQTPRTADEIKQKYGEACAQAGNLQYQIEIQSADLKQLYATMKELNLEHAARVQLDKTATPTAQSAATQQQGQ